MVESKYKKLVIYLFKKREYTIQQIYSDLPNINKEQICEIIEDYLKDKLDKKGK